ncbi:hypothetical protein TREMEDRAFT_69764 [Tremella mesenterica DSM 1558]|uniref:uncharacterized protein n=1 Tax=Tremella mesenterica (strain ATCC 24925 / CBS 8224 / DSM 1558 / NBRC 9311 / NRRL Y-6157 / RJB 2259-6 / UBC 559-6) TaxID=578456 RepID=UPI0003F49058|nr:uncharacterized protein TREMEDRAFT_69764 [Tremella mesenterica DSM 1558]EIW67274.1 hypothetical protein TREMEDRAFT_69764 [Tremella mesenterica DSM 1558]
MDERPRVPPPIYLRSSSPQPQSGRGSLRIHVPAWGVVFVRPPRQLELHPSETNVREPPTEDTVLTGTLEVIMKERRRCQTISVGVQSVCRLHMGPKRGWEEDGIFERGVEVLGGNSEGIWLEKGSQSFSFSILLPATLATHDRHTHCRLSYILTARIEGIPTSSSSLNYFKRDSSLSKDIEFKSDFEIVIARSDRLAMARSKSGESFSPNLDPNTQDDTAITIGEGSPSLTGLYHRQQSNDIQNIPTLNLGKTKMDDTRSIMSVKSNMSDNGQRTEKQGWLKGDMVTSRSLIVYANPSSTGDVSQLDLRKDGFVDGLGSWIFSVTSDQFSISSVLLLSVHFPSPSPKVTIFLLRLLLSQSYSIISPRTPNDPPHMPEAPKNHVLYQVGRAHKSGERFPSHEVNSLWRGPEAGGNVKVSEEGLKIRAIARMPDHDKIRPSTNEGTITPIRVNHALLLQVFYSVNGESITGAPIEGPGELRMMQVRLGVNVPSCCCTASALHLPDYQTADASPRTNIDEMLASPPSKHYCMCGSTFAELSEAAMQRQQAVEQDQHGGYLGDERERSGRKSNGKEDEARLSRSSPG